MKDELTDYLRESLHLGRAIFVVAVFAVILLFSQNWSWMLLWAVLVALLVLTEVIYNYAEPRVKGFIVRSDERKRT